MAMTDFSAMGAAAISDYKSLLNQAASGKAVDPALILAKARDAGRSVPQVALDSAIAEKRFAADKATKVRRWDEELDAGKAEMRKAGENLARCEAAWKDAQANLRAAHEQSRIAGSKVSRVSSDRDEATRNSRDVLRASGSESNWQVWNLSGEVVEKPLHLLDDPNTKIDVGYGARKYTTPDHIIDYTTGSPVVVPRDQVVA